MGKVSSSSRAVCKKDVWFQLSTRRVQAPPLALPNLGDVVTSQGFTTRSWHVM